MLSGITSIITGFDWDELFPEKPAAKSEYDPTKEAQEIAASMGISDGSGISGDNFFSKLVEQLQGMELGDGKNLLEKLQEGGGNDLFKGGFSSFGEMFGGLKGLDATQLSEILKNGAFFSK